MSKLKICKTCGAEYSRNAKTCVKCGEPNKEYEGSVAKFIKGCLWLFLFFMLLGAVGSIIIDSSRTSISTVAPLDTQPAPVAGAPAEPDVPDVASLEYLALSECKYQLTKHLGVAGQSGSLPDSKNWSNKGEFMYSWPRGSFSLNSLMGVIEPSVSCGGRLEPLKIEWITINGQDYEPFKIRR